MTYDIYIILIFVGTIVARKSGNDNDDTTTTLEPNIVTTISLPISKEDEPQPVTKAVETTIGITSKVTTADVGTQKPAITTTPTSPATTISENVPPQTEGKQPVTTLKTQLTTTKETVAPTVIATETPGTTLNTPITTTPSSATTNPVTIGNTVQQESSAASKPIETTQAKPIETTPSKPIETTPSMTVVATTDKPVVTTFAKPAETTMAKTVTDPKQLL